jgi:beta-aspartyl-peptidase (threonine type)
MKTLLDLGGDGGVVSIDKAGNIHMPFNSEGMYRASKNKGHTFIGIYRD